MNTSLKGNEQHHLGQQAMTAAALFSANQSGGGGAVSHMDQMSAWRFLYPPESLIEGVVISPLGERIAAEDA